MKFVLSLEGGGECVDYASCTSRAATQLGSSTEWGNKTALYAQVQAVVVSTVYSTCSSFTYIQFAAVVVVVEVVVVTIER